LEVWEGRGRKSCEKGMRKRNGINDSLATWMEELFFS